MHHVNRAIHSACRPITAIFFAFLTLQCASLWAAPEPEPLPEPTKPSATGDESPMMLYLVPWNANPENNKNAKKFTLYQPWGEHFDPLTPQQAADLYSQ
jgi:hypothetical protein